MARLADIIQAGMGSVRQEEENARQGTKNALLRVSDKLGERASYERSAAQLNSIASRTLGVRGMFNSDMVMEYGAEALAGNIQTEIERRTAASEGKGDTYENGGSTAVTIEKTKDDRMTKFGDEALASFPNAIKNPEAFNLITASVDNSTTAAYNDSVNKANRNLKLLDTYEKEKVRHTANLATTGDQAIFDRINNVEFDVNNPEASLNNLTKTAFQGVFDASEKINNMNKAKLLVETDRANIKKYEGIFSADNTLARMAIMNNPEISALYLDEEGRIIKGTEDAFLQRILSVQGVIDSERAGSESAKKELKDAVALQKDYYSSNLFSAEVTEPEKKVVMDLIRGITKYRDGDLFNAKTMESFEIEDVDPNRAFRFSEDQKIIDMVQDIDQKLEYSIDTQNQILNTDLSQSNLTSFEANTFTAGVLSPDTEEGETDEMSTAMKLAMGLTDNVYVKPEWETPPVENLNLSPEANQLKAKLGGGEDKPKYRATTRNDDIIETAEDRFIWYMDGIRDKRTMILYKSIKDLKENNPDITREQLIYLADNVGKSSDSDGANK